MLMSHETAETCKRKNGIKKKKIHEQNMSKWDYKNTFFGVLFLIQILVNIIALKKILKKV